jgi:hypothetical protein
LHERFPHPEKTRLVNSEHLNRDAADFRPSAQRRPRPLEVLVPQVYAWMEESNERPRLWFRYRDVRTLVTISVKASESIGVERVAELLDQHPGSRGMAVPWLRLESKPALD